MAKVQKRSGREPKKPRQGKPKVAASRPPFAAVPEKPGAAPATKK